MRNRHSHSATVLLAAVAIALFFAHSVAQATALDLPEINIQVGPDDNLMNVTAQMLEANSALVVENSDGSFTFSNGSMTVPDVWQWDWSSLTVKTDPFVGSAFGFKNLSGVTMPFTISVSLPVPALGPTTLIGGSMGGSVSDTSFDGLGGLSTIAPDALYTGMIDGVGVVPAAELYPDPYSSPAFAFAGDTVNILATSFGLPGPSVPGPAVGVSIGIVNKFSLSSMDSVSMTNFFVVEQVPEPSSIVLAVFAGVALLFCAARRRRRS